MRKTSIFSREYERKIRRRRFIVVLIILAILVVIVFYIINFSRINSYIKDKYYSIISKEIVSVQEDFDKQDIDREDINQSLTPNIDKELNNENINDDINDDINDEVYNDGLYKEIELDGHKFNLKYSILEDGKIEYIDFNNTDNLPYRFDISPDKSKMIIENISNQNTYLVNNEFNVIKLDPEYFYSNSANTKFYKENVMSTNEGYNWYNNARFLDNNTIIYISNLPWFGKDEEYIWKTDISDVNNIRHFMTKIGAQNIELGELTEQGIKVNINNEMKLLTFSFVLN